MLEFAERGVVVAHFREQRILLFGVSICEEKF